MKVARAKLWTDLPPESAAPLQSPSEKVVILDDDPTGTQTVHGIPVLTRWEVTALAAELLAPDAGFFILTNSRAHSAEAAVRINREIGQNLRAASAQTERTFTIISRGDSTLRGHYPVETDALSAGLDFKFDAVLLIPAFFDGGRFTIHDVHYVQEGEWLIPAAETEFARDPVFHYAQSNLRYWVQEKTGGKIGAQDVGSISVTELRTCPNRAVDKLLAAAGGVLIVNAVAPSDLRAAVQAIASAESAGRRFLVRSGASFVAPRIGQTSGALLAPTRSDGDYRGGGLLVVGSFTGRTSRQLDRALAQNSLRAIEVKVPRLLDPKTRAEEIARAIAEVDAWLFRKKDVALFTSRQLIVEQEGADGQDIGHAVSTALVEVVRSLKAAPRWLIAKGGITSSDLATEALGVRRAVVDGQAIPGVPVWRLGPESRWPGLAFTIFPGNVGSDNALAELIAMYTSAV